MERDAQVEREMPRDISYYRERATQLNQVLFETSRALNGGVPIEDDWAVEDLPRMVERVVKRAEDAESRVRELETSNASLIGAINGLIIETRKMLVAGGELEASCAAMRDALNKWKLLAHFMSPPDDWRTGESLASLCQECILAGEQALSTTAGKELLDRVEKLERVIGAIEGHDITLLRKKVNQLKGTDGEGWAVGEMLERALVALDS